MAKQETRINRDIRARQVRVVDDEGELLGILTVPEALAAAEERGLDLVEVSPNADPPVCRIMDYGKYKYQASKRAAEAKKKSAKVEVKEVKMRPKTEEHDFQVKLRNARRFLDDGNRVKVTVMFRGREVTHPEFGRRLMEKLAEQVSDIAQVEMTPRMAGRFMTMVVAPKK
ncbi:translation initiation factor IF-3 [Syntrophotalea acetylenivorans]|uniref:Translation initiation factor IF-3 n=1 Tax=Syntrophotalea acetylenivorans TaxID=1842532 RepID=A0A1L3GLP3_9BACT|nr:translation initiation factor IF-3 [Syntrophotalea acetylenivorans]APG26811.1 translation initiation factor IF-3 [Syntrophotalea acetylenivorans]